MRNLLLLVGPPGAGKTTWLRDNDLFKYALSLDTFRGMLSQPKLMGTHHATTAVDYDKVAVDLFNRTLENRLANGSFTIIDNTSMRGKSLNQAKVLAKRYGYRIFYKSFLDVPIETVLNQNMIRHYHEKVPNDDIMKMHENTDAIKKILNTNSFTEIQELHDIPFASGIEAKPVLASAYKDVIFVGDIHGCSNELDKFIETVYTEDKLFVFVGDYIDRGPDAPGVLRKLRELYNNGNIYLLEGNHEKWLRHWSNSDINLIRSQSFRDTSGKQFIEAGYTKKEGRSFVDKLQLFVKFEFKERVLFACHGGVSMSQDYHEDYAPFSADNYIKGQGSYKSIQQMYDMGNRYMHGNSLRMIHGHRNIGGKFVQEGVFVNLEGKIEQGGELRYYSANDDKVYFIESETDVNKLLTGTDKQNVEMLRNNPNIIEKKMNDFVSSFNFDREAFQEGIWNDMTINARGLFIAVDTGKVIARGYNKFFNFNERTETKIESLEKNLKFPVKAYKKENGFLGIVSWHEKEGLMFCTKSTFLETDYTEMFRQMVNAYIDVDAMQEFLENEDVSIVFEVCHVNDPHIVNMEEKLVLLDIIENGYEFKRYSYDLLEMVHKKLFKPNRHGLPNPFTIKVGKYVLSDIDELKMFIDTARTETDHEGYVLEDANGFMFKYKNPWYAFWKRMRSFKERLLKLDKQGLRNDKTVGTMIGRELGQIRQYPVQYQFYDDAITEEIVIRISKMMDNELEHTIAEIRDWVLFQILL